MIIRNERRRGALEGCPSKLQLRYVFPSQYSLTAAVHVSELYGKYGALLLIFLAFEPSRLIGLAPSLCPSLPIMEQTGPLPPDPDTCQRVCDLHAHDLTRQVSAAVCSLAWASTFLVPLPLFSHCHDHLR